MASIIFKKVRYKNFLAVGDRFIEVDLTRSKTTLVTGHNGAGKTTILEGIVYGLYGKPYRNIKLGGLINRINKKNSVVEVEFQIGTREYKVVRGQKPKVFEIYEDGELIEADAAAKDYQARLEAVLGMDYRLFTQIVILNKARFVPFMALSAPDRRKVVEDILDIGIFTTMNQVAKEKLGVVKNKVSDLEYTRDMKKKDIDLQKALIEQAKSNTEAQVTAHKTALARCEADLGPLEDLIAADLASVDEYLKTITDSGSARSLFDDLKTKAIKVTGHINTAKKSREFFEQSSCPTCNQELSAELKESKLTEFGNKIDTYTDGLSQIKEKASEVSSRLKEIEAVESAVSELKNVIRENQFQAKIFRDNIQRALKEIERLTNKNSDVSQNERILAELESELESLNSELEELVKDRQALNNIQIILKDNGVKAEIIKQHMPLVNKSINEYLHQIGFVVNFFLDENFEEDFKNGDDFSYFNLSDGQKLRVDLAILLAWIEVAASKNSAHCNLLFLDEILEAMDLDGLNLFMRLVRNKLTDKNLFVISQRGPELQDHFRSEITFKLNNGFTQLERN